jgi:Na+-transporting NADH:ubiquinone oxidoreductase subunit B
MAGPLLGAVAACLLLRHACGVEAVPLLPFTLFSGALLYGVVFMVTEPVSAPKKRPAMWVYGLFIGAMIVFLRWKAQFAGAVGFAILLGNIVGPTLDLAVAAWAERKKGAQAEGAQP